MKRRRSTTRSHARTRRATCRPCVQVLEFGVSLHLEFQFRFGVWGFGFEVWGLGLRVLYFGIGLGVGGWGLGGSV